MKGKLFRPGIRYKFAVLIGILIVVLMVVDVLWNTVIQYEQSEKESLETAQVIADEMQSVWDFIDINQTEVNRNEDGTFRSKALVCVVAAKSVSTLFTINTDYTIRYVSPTPRQTAGTPDALETRAFDAFSADASLERYTEIEADESGQRVFRYVKPLMVTETCLECHGEPVGELDQYGYAKEGVKVGDIGGAISISVPMGIYDSGMQASIFQQLVMVLVVLVLACVTIYIGMSKLVLKPLDALNDAARQIGEGNFDYRLEKPSSTYPDEMMEFVADFDKMARQLERLYTNLEGEVQSKTDKLTALNEMLLYQKAELKKTLDTLSAETAYKNEFFAIMSHELRTPLTSILAFARILRDEEPLDSKTRNAVEEIEVNASLLLNMVNNILSISKSDAHKNQLMTEAVDFVDLLGLIKNSLEPVATKKGITLTAKTDADVPICLADWEKLRRILENLTDNAIKYTHAGGKVALRAHFDQESIVLEVEDDGVGIAPENQEGIFEQYHQAAQSSNRRYRGTGLGLAVVKDLTELHGGTVSLVSVPKQGTTFTVRIPYVPVLTEE